MAVCLTCRAGTVLITAEEPGPLGVFCDPCHGNDQALQEDRPHGSITTRKSAKIQLVFREWGQVCQLQNYINLKRNNQMT